MRWGVAWVVVVFALALTAPTAQAGGLLNVPWTTLLPPLDGHHYVEAEHTPFCPQPEDGCVDRAIAKMDALRRRFGCDHRAIFAVTYELLTEKVKEYLDRAKHGDFFQDRDRLIAEDALFAQYYFNMQQANDEGRWRDIPEAWQIALRAGQRGDISAVQDMLLGINAHVQRDMPFVLAGVGLRMKDGRSTKPDHDRFNDVLEAAFDPITDEIARIYDPNTALLAPQALPFDNVAGLEVVKVWREQVWRNAERLIRARGNPARLQAVSRQIEGNAARWARLIASVKVPGEPMRRDAYCAAHLQQTLS